MWRWLALVVLVVAISAVAAWVSISLPGNSSTSSSLAFPTGIQDSTEPKGPLPKIVVSDETEYDFGTMAQQTKGTREWVVKNEGPGELILTGTQPTCSCTVIDPKPDEDVKVAPGESYTVRVEWETRQFQDKYEKTARILTNDPSRPDLTFVVSGIVRPAIVTYPADGFVNAQTVSNDAPHGLEVVITSPDRPETKILDMQSSRPDLIALEQIPLSEAEMTRLETKGGYKVIVVIKPTPILGSFREEVVIKTDHPLRDEVRLVVAGRVVGPISITPPVGIRMTNVEGPKGKTSVVILAVRGQERTSFEVASVPGKLEVKVVPLDEGSTEGTDEKDAASGNHRYRVEITVPPGTPPGVIDQPIVLKTDHPRASEVQVPVYIRILGKS